MWDKGEATGPREALARFLPRLGVILVAAAVLFTASAELGERERSRRTDDVVARLERLIPASQGGSVPLAGSSPAEFPMLEIDEVSYVGLLRLPSLGTVLPVRGGDGGGLEDLREAPYLYDRGLTGGSIVLVGWDSERQFGGLRGVAVRDRVELMDADGTVLRFHVNSLTYVDKFDPTDPASQDSGLILSFFDSRAGSYAVLRCSPD